MDQQVKIKSEIVNIDTMGSLKFMNQYIYCVNAIYYLFPTHSLLYSNAKKPSIPYFCSRFLSHSIKSRCWNQQIFVNFMLRDIFYLEKW